MRLKAFIIAVCLFGWALIISATIPKQTEKPELQLAEIYQSPMVVAEIKHQAPAPAKTESSPTFEQKKETSGNLSAIITHYCACSKCNGKWSYEKDGLNYTETASGILLYDFIDGNYCAATFGKIGDILTINGTDYQIVDRMGGNSGKRVDIFVAAGHDKCNELGRYTAEVMLKGE